MTNVVNNVFTVFKPAGGIARYVVGPDVLGSVQGVIAQQITQADLNSFGIGRLTADCVDRERGIVEFNPYKGLDKASVRSPALFTRLDELFPGKRLPVDLTANAAVSYPQERLHTSVIMLFAALMMSGATVSSELHHPVQMLQSGDECAPIDIKNRQGWLRAHFQTNDVNLTFTYPVETMLAPGARTIIDGNVLFRPCHLTGNRMILEVALADHRDTVEGNQILADGAQKILTPLVGGDAPMFVSPYTVDGNDVRLVIGVRDGVSLAELPTQGASQALGIKSRDGRIDPSKLQ